jgi:hypothetical protein
MACLSEAGADDKGGQCVLTGCLCCCIIGLKPCVCVCAPAIMCLCCCIIGLEPCVCVHVCQLLCACAAASLDSSLVYVPAAVCLCCCIMGLKPGVCASCCVQVAPTAGRAWENGSSSISCKAAAKPGLGGAPDTLPQVIKPLSLLCLFSAGDSAPLLE